MSKQQKKNAVKCRWK